MSRVRLSLRFLEGFARYYTRSVRTHALRRFHYSLYVLRNRLSVLFFLIARRLSNCFIAQAIFDRPLLRLYGILRAFSIGASGSVVCFRITNHEASLGCLDGRRAINNTRFLRLLLSFFQRRLLIVVGQDALSTRCHALGNSVFFRINCGFHRSAN